MPRIDAAPCMRALSANPKPVKAIASAIARVACVAGEPSSVEEISVKVSSSAVWPSVTAGEQSNSTTATAVDNRALHMDATCP